MEQLDPTFIGIVVLTGGVGLAMVLLGSRLNMLERRETSRRCPSCGLSVKTGRRCACLR
jgi:hypothetical protein